MPQNKNFVNFDAAGDAHRQMRLNCAKSCQAFNAMAEDAAPEERIRKWCAITGQDPDQLEPPPVNSANKWLVPYVKGPIWVDYGTGISVGRSTFINRHCMIFDSTVSKVIIGEDCSIGPRVSIISVTHPKDRRVNRGPLAIPSVACDVVIGNNCWIGGGATILPGVTIGEGAVIGACAVVTKDVPPYHVAYGNPARVHGTVAPDVPDVTKPSILATVSSVSNHLPRNMDQLEREDGRLACYKQPTECVPDTICEKSALRSQVSSSKAPGKILNCNGNRALNDIALHLICGLSFLMSLAALIISWNSR